MALAQMVSNRRPPATDGVRSASRRKEPILFAPGGAYGFDRVLWHDANRCLRREYSGGCVRPDPSRVLAGELRLEHGIQGVLSAERRVMPSQDQRGDGKV